MILYERLGEKDLMYVRSVDNFLEIIEKGEYKGPRFVYQGSCEEIFLARQNGTLLR